MSAPYKIIFDFLQETGPGVSARSATPVSPETRAKMRLFAQGKLHGEELLELEKSLNANPAWITALAQEVKSMRQHREEIADEDQD